MDIYDVKQIIKKTILGKQIYNFYWKSDHKKENEVIRLYGESEDSKKFGKFKDSVQGKRCFVIGNGPSLTISDLELIKNEDTFASNRIYGVFKESDWRPTYYCVQDIELLKTIKNDISEYMNEFPHIFLPYNIKNILPDAILNNTKVCYFYTAWRQGGQGEICFNEECEHFIGAGMTVTYAMIQMAAWMGYKEIYLLGVDHNYTVDKAKKPTDASYASFIAKTDLSKQNSPHVEESEKAYIVAREQCAKLGVKVANATRGGKLEVYPREKLEDILK